MIATLISGRLIANPESRTSAGGNPFTTARLAAGTDDDSVLCSVIAFGTAGQQLAALTKGDTAALVGRSKPKTWTGRDGQLKTGLDMVADQLLTAYHVRRKRAAMEPQAKAEPTQGARPAANQLDEGPTSEPDAGLDEDRAWLRGGGA